MDLGLESIIAQSKKVDLPSKGLSRLERFQKASEASIFQTAENNDISSFLGGNNVDYGKLSEQLKNELDELKKKKNDNDKKIKETKNSIEKLVKKIDTQITLASVQKENTIKDHDKKVKKVIDEQVKKYIADKHSGKDVTKEELDKNIKSALPDVPGLPDAISSIMEAQDLTGEVDSLSEQLSSLLAENEQLTVNIDETKMQYEYARDKAASDPIGFNYNGDTFELVYGDAVNSKDDIVGKNNGISELFNSDLDGDGRVTTEEMDKAGINMFSQNSKEIKSVSELFGAGSYFDISSYQKNTNGNLTYEGIDTSVDANNNGVQDFELVGTLDFFTENGEKINSFQTNVDDEILEEMYGLNPSNADISNAQKQKSGAKGNFSTLEGEMYKNQAALYNDLTETANKDIEEASEQMKNTNEMGALNAFSKISTSDKNEKIKEDKEDKRENFPEFKSQNNPFTMFKLNDIEEQQENENNKKLRNNPFS